MVKIFEHFRQSIFKVLLLLSFNLTVIHYFIFLEDDSLLTNIAKCGIKFLYTTNPDHLIDPECALIHAKVDTTMQVSILLFLITTY